MGKLADLVLWTPAFFGVKPDLVLKGGIDRRRQHGRSQRLDPDAAAHALPADVRRSFGRNDVESSVLFVSRAGVEADVARKFGLSRAVVAVENCRGGISKASMVHNNLVPKMEVDAETYEVRADGVLLTCEPAKVLPMAQRYFLF